MPIPPSAPIPAAAPRRGLLAALPTLLALALLGFAARWFAARWQAVMGDGPPPPIAWGWLAVGFVLLALNAVLALAIWRQVLAAVGAPVRWRQALDTQAPSLLARYLPGKVWANAVRVALARRAGVAVGSGAGAVVWETLVMLGAAGLVALAGLGWHGEANATRAAAGLVAGIAAAWMLTALVSRHPRGAALLARVGGTGPVRSPAALAPSVLLGIAGLLTFGAAHLAIARAVAPVGLADYPLVAGAVALAWAGGFLAIVMPLGLGVRDGILLVLLAPVLSPAQGLLFVALSRLVQLGLDAVVTGGWMVGQVRWRRPAA
ncbi:MAG: flippase-like domain-containing protein [Gemmatimonadaceae bacterium]|nr:flippase-like domain-containing protein [Gemmatimonadaceae bacterium]